MNAFEGWKLLGTVLREKKRGYCAQGQWRWWWEGRRVAHSAGKRKLKVIAFLGDLSGIKGPSQPTVDQFWLKAYGSSNSHSVHYWIPPESIWKTQPDLSTSKLPRTAVLKAVFFTLCTPSHSGSFKVGRLIMNKDIITVPRRTSCNQGKWALRSRSSLQRKGSGRTAFLGRGRLLNLLAYISIKRSQWLDYFQVQMFVPGSEGFSMHSKPDGHAWPTSNIPAAAAVEKTDRK